jgi:hypothetical protein
MASRGIVTMAYGDSKYVDMAKSLARSLKLHYPEMPRAIVTDSIDPEIPNLFTSKIDHRPEYGTNVRQKMFIDQYSPFDETLFIDSDSLVVRNLDHFWDAFKGLPFGACGMTTLRAGDTDRYGYLDVDFILNYFTLESLDRFNGGVYYFNKSRESAALFETARDLLNHHAELKFSDFRGDGPGDEVLYTVAMALHGVRPIDFGNAGMWTPLDVTGPVLVDIPQSVCTFTKAGRLVNPDIVHFVGYTECLKLRALKGSSAKLSAVQDFSIKMNMVSIWVPGKINRLKQSVLSKASYK